MFITDTAKLKEQLAAKRISIEDLANYIGVDRSTMYRRLEKNTLQIKDMQKAAEMLGLTGEEACAIFLVEQSQ